MKTDVQFYRTFDVLATYNVNSTSDITRVVRQLVELTESIASTKDLSVRILLPKTEGTVSPAKKWGAALRSELIIALKRRRLKPRLREVRYIHDENHYGWLLISPNLLESVQGGSISDGNRY